MISMQYPLQAQSSVGLNYYNTPYLKKNDVYMTLKIF